MNTSYDNIVLIGMPGAGKSTLGVVLAKILQYDFLDADLLIQKAYGQSLKSLIETEGVSGFIEAEGSVLKELNPHRTVIATGGSAIYSEDAMAHLKTLGPMIYLKVDYDSLAERLGDLIERGVVLRGGISMSLDELYDERIPLYESFADLSVSTQDASITEAAYNVANAVRPLLHGVDDDHQFDQFPL